MSNNIGLYIHIPFCIKKCNYCAFLSFCAEGAPLREYTNALADEIKLRANMMRDEAGLQGGIKENIEDENKAVALDTVYIGGGTPSVLAVSHMRDIVCAVKSSFNIKRGAEITIEANPGTLGNNDRAILERLQAYKSMGFNRLSMGVQSMNNERLRFLGRIHAAEDVVRDMRIARAAGFENINLDLMFSVPNESTEDAISDAERIIGLGPEHISCYSLQVEEGTPLANQIESGALMEISDEEDRRTYHRLCALFKNAGYEHYEISNFARTNREPYGALGFEDCGTDSRSIINISDDINTNADGNRESPYRSKHNSLYWEMSDYIGCGLDASGFVHGIRYKNISDIDKYIKAYGNAKVTVIGKSDLLREESLSNAELSLLHKEEQRNSPFDNISEAVFTGLRRREGVTYEEACTAYVKGNSAKQGVCGKKLSHAEEMPDEAEQFFWNVFADAKEEAAEFARQGFLVIDEKGIRLTEQGIDISNQIMALFV